MSRDRKRTAGLQAVTRRRALGVKSLCNGLRLSPWAAAGVALTLLWAAPNAWAIWGDRASVSAGEIQSGRLDAGIALDSQGQQFTDVLDIGELNQMVPGVPKRVTLWVGNTGTVPFVLSLAQSSNTDPAVELAAATGKCEGSTAALTPLGAEFQVIVPTVGVSTRDSVTAVCVGVTLKPGFGEVQNAPFSIRMSAETIVR